MFCYTYYSFIYFLIFLFLLGKKNIFRKCDSMKIVSYSLTNFTAISIVDCFNYYLENEKRKSFFKHIIDPIEQILKKKKIIKFYTLTILSLMLIKTAICALYMSLSNLESNWYQNLLKIIQIVKNDDFFREIYNDLLSLTKEILEDQKNVLCSHQYKESTQKMEKMISNEIEKAIEKLYKLQEKSIIKARENIGKRMSIDIIEDQVNMYIDNIICNKSKFDIYLKESKDEILKIRNYQMKNAFSMNLF